MWKKTADFSIRTVLLASITLYGVTPASATLLMRPAVASPGDEKSPLDLPELAPILAALGDKPNRQTVDTPDRTTSDSHFNDKDRREVEVRLSRITTRKIIEDFNSVKKECTDYDQVYRIDCLRQGIDMIVATLPDNSEYREAKRILRKASSRLGRIVSTYQDRSAPKLEVPANANPRFKKRRKYTAIRREAIPEASAKAQDIVNEAATALLRSGENSERRYVHYQQISVAVDSTKVLLRSL
jgi:hypothetical protein